MIYFLLCVAWGAYGAWKQSTYDKHNEPAWLVGVFLLNACFMPLTVCIWVVRKFFLEHDV